MFDFRFIATGETSSDCTTPYKIEFNKEYYTLGEFMEQILKNGEWGYVEIDKKRIEYREGKIISGNPFLKYYRKRISSCSARGGWSRMDYKIMLDESIDEFEFILEDRIAKIKAINEQYDLEHNAYISFSGGKDSTILHYLIDLALPNNKIPRVYANTGIEYIDMVKFVKSLAKNDDRFVILNQTRNIKKTLNEYGYPFKSKEHSLRVEQFNKNHMSNYIKKYITGIDENIGGETKFKCPKCLLYQFDEAGKYNYSNKCCYKLKKELARKWQQKNNKKIVITGMRNEEGGNRARLTCLTKNNTMFHPLIVVSEEWENEFVERENQSMQVILSTF